MDNLPEAVQVAIFVVVFGLSAWTSIWASKDAERRGKRGCLVGGLVLLSAFPIGLITWLVFRPEKRS